MIKQKFQVICLMLQTMYLERNSINFHLESNVMFLTSDNDFSGIIYILLRGRQNSFLTIFSIKFVVKCATKIFKIGW